jgi:hypothetical protein
LDNFRKRKINLLFSTDLSSRGIDIPCITFVINYDLPDTTDTVYLFLNLSIYIELVELQEQIIWVPLYL